MTEDPRPPRDPIAGFASEIEIQDEVNSMFAEAKALDAYFQHRPFAALRLCAWIKSRPELVPDYAYFSQY